jgi:hypothetical protein
VLVANVFGAKRAEEHGIDGTHDLLFEGFVGRIVLPEKREGLVVGAVEFFNCQVGAVGRNKSSVARVGRNNKGSSRESVVDLQGESELEEAKLAVPEVGVDRGSVGV